MNEQLHTHWINLITPLFPDYVDLKSEPDAEDFVLSASWLLNNDPAQPAKRSRTIVIEVPRQTINEYTEKNESRRADDDEKLYMQIKEFLHFLNPDHQSISEDTTPEVRLVAGSSVLCS